MNFEFVPKKASANLRKHGVAFAEVEPVFYDNLALTQADGGTHRELGCPIAIMCHVLCASERGYYHHNAH